MAAPHLAAWTICRLGARLGTRKAPGGPLKAPLKKADSSLLNRQARRAAQLLEDGAAERSPRPMRSGLDPAAPPVPDEVSHAALTPGGSSSGIFAPVGGGKAHGHKVDMKLFDEGCKVLCDELVSNEAPLKELKLRCAFVSEIASGVSRDVRLVARNASLCSRAACTVQARRGAGPSRAASPRGAGD